MAANRCVVGALASAAAKTFALWLFAVPPAQAQPNRAGAAGDAAKAEADTPPAATQPGAAAGAQASPTVYVVAVPADAATAGLASLVERAAQEALRRTDPRGWQMPDRRYLGYDDGKLETLQRARARLNEGREAYVALDLPKAAELLTSAVADFDASADTWNNPGDLESALLFLGATHVFADQLDEAARVFRRIHVQMPQAAPDPDVFNPRVIDVYRRAQPRGRPRGSLRVTSDPPGARVYVDYRLRGVTPTTVDRLRFGSHRVTLVRPGAEVFSHPVTIRSRRAVPLRAELPERRPARGLNRALLAMRAAAYETMPAEHPAREVARLLGAAHLGVLLVKQRGQRADIELGMFDLAGARRLVHRTIRVSTETAALESGVAELVDSALWDWSQARLVPPRPVAVVVPEVAPPPPPPPVDDGPAHEQWWFWGLLVLAAGGVAAGTVGAIMAIDNITGSDPGGQIVLEF